METAVVRVTHPPHHHFFGYYDKQQWDPTGRYLLGLQTAFADRPPAPDDRAVIGMVDLEHGYEFIPLGDTAAWCWQQGTMLQWLPGRERKVIHNDRVGDRFVSVVLDVDTGERRTLPRPVYSVSDDGKWALSLNFSRLTDTRPGYGYAGLVDHWDQEPHPTGDGIYLMSLETGNHRLVVDLASLVTERDPACEPGAKHWVNHLLFNPTGERFVFLHRWSEQGRFRTRFYTADRNGGDRRLFPVERGSHFIWFDAEHVLIWAFTDEGGAHYYLCNDLTGEVEVFAPEDLTRDGHCTISPDERWILTDEYPNQSRVRPLILYDVPHGKRYDISTFFSPPTVSAELRCDLHPRWSRDGRFVCVDSTHEGSRQMYVLDVSGFRTLT